MSPCFQKIKEKEKVPDKCPHCGHKIVDDHCFQCQGKGISKNQEMVIYN